MKAGIVGGGIMGQVMAYSLVGAGWDVSLFDKGEAANCSQSAAGLLTPLAELARNDISIFQLGSEALIDHWPALLTHLKAEIYFKQAGSLLVSHPKDKSDLDYFVKMIERKKNGINSTFSGGEFIQALTQTQITALEPELSKFDQGYYFPHEGQIDNQRLLEELKKYLISQKVKWFEKTTVSTITPGEITTALQTYSFDWVFDCRGLGSKEHFTDLHSVRGELIWLKAPDVHITRPIRFMHPRYGLYIVPRPDQIYLIGATEIESEDFSEISVQSILELLTAAYAVNSKFAEARILKTVTQCRPTLTDRRPQIKYTDGLIALNGLYRHGFLIAPSLAHEVMQWFAPSRFLRYPTLWEKF